MGTRGSGRESESADEAAMMKGVVVCGIATVASGFSLTSPMAVRPTGNCIAHRGVRTMCREGGLQLRMAEVGLARNLSNQTADSLFVTPPTHAHWACTKACVCCAMDAEILHSRTSMNSLYAHNMLIAHRHRQGQTISRLQGRR